MITALGIALIGTGILLMYAGITDNSVTDGLLALVGAGPTGYAGGIAGPLNPNPSTGPSGAPGGSTGPGIGPPPGVIGGASGVAGNVN